MQRVRSWLRPIVCSQLRRTALSVLTTSVAISLSGLALAQASKDKYVPVPLKESIAQRAGKAKSLSQWYVNFELKHGLEVYRTIGQRGEKWNAAAEAFLNMTARYHGGIYSRPDIWNLVPAGKAAIDAGCTDPIVLAAYGEMLAIDDQNPKVADEQLRQAWEGLNKAKVHPIHKMRCAYWLAVTATEMNQFDRSTERLKDVAEHAVAWLSAPDMSVEEQRYAYATVGNMVYNRLPPGRAKQVIDAIDANPKVPRFLRAMLRGDWELRSGMRARGDDERYRVSYDEWRGARDRFLKAKEQYEAARAACPTCPEPLSTLMIFRGFEEDKKKQDARYWLDEVIKIEPDHTTSFSVYANTLEGATKASMDKSIELFKECADLDRPDLPIGYTSVLHLRDAAWTTGSYEFPWQQPEVYSRAKAVLEAATKWGDAQVTNDSRVMLACIATWAREWSDARAALELIPPGELVHDATYSFRLTPKDIQSHVYAATCQPIAKLVAQAVKDMDGKQYAQAASGLREAQKLLPPGDTRAADGVADLLARASFAADFDAGRWIRMPASEQLHGWRATQSEWKGNPATREISVSPRDGARLIWATPVGDRFELVFTMDVSKLVGPSVQASAVRASDGPAGAVFFSLSEDSWDHDYYSVAFWPKINQLSVGNWILRDIYRNLPGLTDGPKRYTLQVYDGRLRISDGPQVLLDITIPPQERWRLGQHFGFGTRIGFWGGQMSIRDIQIRKLLTRPDELKPK